MDCLFCKIAKGEIPAKIHYEDEKCMVFEDIEPSAPVHLLAIPKKHIESVSDIEKEDEALIGHIFGVLKKVSKDEGLENGYRIIVNKGEDGLQSVMHIHFHLLGGRRLAWEM